MAQDEHENRGEDEDGESGEEQVGESGEVDADPSRSKCASCGQRLMVGSCFIRKQALTSESRTANMAS